MAVNYIGSGCTTPFPFFFNDTATTDIYPLSLHDALPISPHTRQPARRPPGHRPALSPPGRHPTPGEVLSTRPQPECPPQPTAERAAQNTPFGTGTAGQPTDRQPAHSGGYARALSHVGSHAM